MTYRDFIGQLAEKVFLDTENNQFYTQDGGVMELPLHYRAELESIKGSEDFYKLGSAIEAEAEADQAVREALGLKPLKPAYEIVFTPSNIPAEFKELVIADSESEAIEAFSENFTGTISRVTKVSDYYKPESVCRWI